MDSLLFSTATLRMDSALPQARELRAGRPTPLLDGVASDVYWGRRRASAAWALLASATNQAAEFLCQSLGRLATLAQSAERTHFAATRGSRPAGTLPPLAEPHAGAGNP